MFVLHVRNEQSEADSDPLPGSLDIRLAEMEVSGASAALSSRLGADNWAQRAPVVGPAGEKPYHRSDSKDMMRSNAICLELLHYDTAHDCLPFLTNKHTDFIYFLLISIHLSP